MDRPSYSNFDTKDDRREVFTLIGKLGPREQIAWMRWCCQRSSLDQDGTIRPRITKDTLALATQAQFSKESAYKLHVDLYEDFWKLTIQWRLDANIGISELVRLVRLQ